VLVQQGPGGSYWSLNASNAIAAVTPLNATLPSGWILRSMTAKYVLLQAGDGGMAGLWEMDANGTPTVWHPVTSSLPGWILRGIDEP